MGPKMSNWLHKFLNPHCPRCIDESVNPIVEELKTQLESIRYERDRLLKYILDDKPNNINDTPKEDEETQPILPKIVPWHVRRQMLEDEDRKKASLMRQTKEEQTRAIAEMEKNLGIVENTVLQVGDEDVQSEPVKVNE